MLKARKRRANAVGYQYNLYGCADYLFKSEGKTYIYEPVLMREAKKLAGKSQALFSLYRDLHKSTSCKIIYGVRAVCADDFNHENFLCKIKVSAEAGTNALFMEDNL